jgi:hypothetical protein
MLAREWLRSEIGLDSLFGYRAPFLHTLSPEAGSASYILVFPKQTWGPNGYLLLRVFESLRFSLVGGLRQQIGYVHGHLVDLGGVVH